MKDLDTPVKPEYDGLGNEMEKGKDNQRIHLVRVQPAAVSDT